MMKAQKMEEAVMSGFRRLSARLSAGVAVSVVGALLAWGNAAQAATVTFQASGTGTDGDNISAKAVFEDGVFYDFGTGGMNAIKITLTNLSDPLNFRGNLLTSVFWSGWGGTDLPTTSPGFDGMAGKVFTDTAGNSTPNVDIAPAINNGPTDGTYQLSNGPFSIANDGNDFSAYDYGIATVGMGLAGFNGGAVNDDDYGIASASTNLTSDGLPQALPFIDQMAMFWIAVPEEFTVDGISDTVAFGFGSKPDNTLVTPLPAAAWLFGTGLLGLIGIARRKKAA